jgi:hypothetical protein
MTIGRPLIVTPTIIARGRCGRDRASVTVEMQADGMLPISRLATKRHLSVTVISSPCRFFRSNSAVSPPRTEFNFALKGKLKTAITAGVTQFFYTSAKLMATRTL